MRRRELHPLSKVVRYLISVAFATSDRLCHAVTLCVAVHTASQIKPMPHHRICTYLRHLPRKQKFIASNFTGCFAPFPQSTIRKAP